VIKAKTFIPLPEAKQTKQDSALAMLDELTEQELKTAE